MNLKTEYFVSLVLQLSEGRVSSEFFLNWLDYAIETIENDYLEVQERCNQTAYHEESPDEIDRGLLGLEEYREAMGLVEEYLEYGETQLLQEAANLALSAHQNLNHATEENEAKALKDSLGGCF